LFANFSVNRLFNIAGYSCGRKSKVPVVSELAAAICQATLQVECLNITPG